MVVQVVDFESTALLTEAIRGNDAVIDVCGTPDSRIAIPRCLIEAAAAAGVYRFIPGEFNNDSKNEATRSLPVFQPTSRSFCLLVWGLKTRLCPWFRGVFGGIWQTNYIWS